MACSQQETLLGSRYESNYPESLFTEYWFCMDEVLIELRGSARIRGPGTSRSATHFVDLRATT